MSIEDVPKGCIRTNSGLYINVFDPKPEMLCIEDIAHGTAYQPRFAGHLNRHYSVAQHSILASERATPKNKLAALLHDGSEAFMLDMPTPIKAMLPDYKMYENQLMAVIAKKYGFEFPFDPEIKIIDKYLVNLEWEMLVVNNDKNFKCMTAIQAKKEFLRVYYELTGKQGC
jgi:5'-deoxynucleotidase YfbR-like HD superfamily hydrolase